MARSSWLPLTFLVLLVGITIASAVIGFGRDYSDEFFPVFWPERVEELFTRLISGGLFALILWRRPGNIIGYLLILETILLAFSTLLVEYAYFSLVRYPGLFPGGVFADRLQAALAPTGTAVAALWILHFPNGRPASPRWKWVIWLVGAGVLNFVILAILTWPTLGFISPKATMAQFTLLGVMFNAGFVALILAYLMAAISGIQRFRHSQGDERLQLKWIAYALSLQIIAVLYTVSNQLGGPDFIPTWVGWLIGMFPSVSIAIAILKYRLYAIDLVIRRTLVYSILTVILALVYYGSVILMQNVFATMGARQSSAAIVLSTLVIAALFSPLRRRVQDFIDRRFYRRKYNAEKSLAALSVMFRDQVELNQLTDHLVSIVDETMQPASISLWLPNPNMVPRKKNSDWPSTLMENNFQG